VRLGKLSQNQLHDASSGTPQTTILMGIPLRTLLVEDSEDDGLLLEHRLREHGFEPQTARVWTAAALGAALGRQDWDIVLCDFMLPGFDAYRALEIVQGSGRSVPVIVVSGIPGEQMVVELLRRGAADYLSKDRLARLGPSVDQALAYARLQRERARAESEREEFDRRFRGMLETMELLAMTLDREGRVTFCNDALVQWSGWNRQEVLGADWFERFVPGTEENVRKLFFEGVATAPSKSHPPEVR
jgi:CheY-like chemotaxis protein